MRRARIERHTAETQISIRLGIEGRGTYQIRTGIRFFDHMLELMAKHGAFDLRIEADGDLDVDQHHTVEDVGIALGEAVSMAGARRFRPILLTSVTTFVGLIPLLTDRSIQAQFLIPMAVSLGFGVIFATAITLILVPCTLLLGEDVGRCGRQFRHWFLAPFERSETRSAATPSEIGLHSVANRSEMVSLGRRNGL